VKKFYRRESTVIYPPVSIQNSELKIQNLKSKRTYFLSVGRLTYAKRIDLAIMACNKLKLPLKIVGVGKEEAYLRSVAGPTIEFMGSISDTELNDLYDGAKALIFCALDEDFGMVPVEAMAHGTPVIALAQGGVQETVVDGKTGVLFSVPEVESLIAALRKLLETPMTAAACRKQAGVFSKEKFMTRMRTIVEGRA
jgi:glycosyltransferase involved in cell wall biosynthesis